MTTLKLLNFIEITIKGLKVNRSKKEAEKSTKHKSLNESNENHEPEIKTKFEDGKVSSSPPTLAKEKKILLKKIVTM